MSKLLVVEDNNDINNLLKSFLQEEYEVTQAYSGTEALSLFKNQDFDIVLLDIMLPGKGGDEVLAEIRQVSTVPVIMLTAIGHKKTVATYLMNGANDYITKPFDEDELKARLQVHLRNSPNGHQGVQKLRCRQLTLDETSYEIVSPRARQSLRLKEFEILKILFQNPKQVFTKEKLYELVWQEPYLPGDNTLNTHLSNLRKKIKALDPDHEYIETIWGLGIRLNGEKE